MSINIGPPAIEELKPRIIVVGVGGAGGNAIANMIAAEIEGVEFVVANTDAQALNNSVSENRIQLGPEITRGLGAGSRPEVGKAAAEETLAEIERALEGAHMCFIAAGMGGGTGTGAAPVIAKAARERGVLTVGVVTKPFLFEGTRRMRSAEAGIEELQKNVDTLIVIPNQNLFLVAKAETTFKEAFQLADEVLQQGVRSITDLMVMPGLINLDFADVRSVMAEMGKAMMGTGEGSGENRALEAAEKAIANPLLDGVSMQGAKGVIISIIGGEDMKLLEVDEAANHIRELVDPQANIIWGSAFNPDLDGKIRVSVVATGIEQGAMPVEEAPRALNLGFARGPAVPSAPAMAPAPEPEPEPEPEPALEPEPAEDRLFDRTPEPEPEPEVQQQPQSFGSFHAPEEASASDLSEDDHAESAEWEEDEAEEDVRSDAYASLNPTPAPFDKPLDLQLEQAEDQPDDPEGGSDELLLDASRLAEDDGPVTPLIPGRRRSFLSGGGESEAPAQSSSGGSTLFERMANLSRGSKSSEEKDEEGDSDDSSAINIPRFLGRQNNQ